MARTYYGDPFETAELTSNQNKYIRFKPNSNIVLKALRTWLIFNDYTGTLTALVGKLYSDRGGLPGALIASSTNSFNKADIITLASGIKEIYFNFNNLPLHSSSYYHLVLSASAYTYSDASHIAWRKAWPDPVYRTGVNTNFEGLGNAPYTLSIIGDDL